MKTSNWKDQLNEIKTEMRSQMTPEEKEKERNEFKKRLPALYMFLAGYKHNSGIY